MLTSSASPICDPRPVTTFSTPGGRSSAADLGHQQQAQRRVLALLTTTVLPAARATRRLEAGDHQRGVPRQDGGDDAQRFATGVLQLVVACRQDHALELSGDAGEVPEEVAKVATSGRACVRIALPVSRAVSSASSSTCFDGVGDAQSALWRP